MSLLDLKPHVRWIRGTISEKLGEQTIETLLVVDQKMAEFYGMDAAKHYALTIANIVSIDRLDYILKRRNLLILKMLLFKSKDC